nr:thiamine pyrophosphokinase 1 isoform X1 [Tanacetum cinerariifolium]
MIHRSTFLLPPTTTTTGDETTTTYALIVLNQRLPRFSPLLWQHAKVRVCADGGANRLFDNMPELCIDEHDVSIIRESFCGPTINSSLVNANLCGVSLLGNSQ